jgi:Xaa-Pro aminopeptidase
VFRAFLFIGVNTVVLFAKSAQITGTVSSYLKKLDIDLKEYDEVWTYLRKHKWGEGKVGL